MAYKTVFLRITAGRDDTPAAVDFAVQVAQRWDAHLFAQFFAYEPDFAECFANAEDSSFLSNNVCYYQEQLRSAESAFRAQTARSSVHATWCTYDPYSRTTLVTLARHADLVMSGRNAIASPKQPGRDLITEHLVLTCGRPVLLLPQGREAIATPQNPVIAWDGSQAATRALHDALPFIQFAKNVTVWTASEGRQREAVPIPGLDIESVLLRHGVSCTRAIVKSDHLATGEALLDECKRQGFDMIVAGAYGHHRLQELILGGVTRDLMRASSVPVLFSH